MTPEELDTIESASGTFSPLEADLIETVREAWAEIERLTAADATRAEWYEALVAGLNKQITDLLGQVARTLEYVRNADQRVIEADQRTDAAEAEVERLTALIPENDERWREVVRAKDREIERLREALGVTGMFDLDGEA